MTTYIEYQLDDGTTLLIETEEEKTAGVTRTGRGKDSNVIKKTNTKFQDALVSVKSSAHYLRQQLNELKADEVEVTFGLKATGEAGNFAIGRVGMAANYTVKLKWRNEESG